MQYALLIEPATYNPPYLPRSIPPASRPKIKNPMSTNKDRGIFNHIKVCSNKGFGISLIYLRAKVEPSTYTKQYFSSFL